MKQEIITTEITVPSKRSYYNDSDSGLMTEFITNITKQLGLPDDWKKYFKFAQSNDFISLLENKSWSAESFRRFKRGNKATYPLSLIETLNEYISNKQDCDKDAERRNERLEYYRNLLTPITSDDSSPEWRFLYSNEEEGLKVVFMKEIERSWSDEKYYNEVAHATINHDGEIIEPGFEIYLKYRATVSRVTEWINEYKPTYEKIMQKAEEIKAQLPKEFFELESLKLSQITQ